MRYEHIAYIDMRSSNFAVILAPGQLLSMRFQHCFMSPRPLSFTHREGRGWSRYSGTLQKTGRKKQLLQSMQRRDRLVNENVVAQ